MTKMQFILSLGDRLSSLPRQDAEEHLSFYSEMIEDRMEEGLSEEEAVAAVGAVDEIAAQILADFPAQKAENEQAKPKKQLKIWEIVLLVLGSPIWLSLGVSALAVILSLYITLWAVIISLWAVFASAVAYALGGIISGFGSVFYGHAINGIALIGTAFFCAGLSIFLFLGCNLATKSSITLIKKTILWIKYLIKKEEV